MGTRKHRRDDLPAPDPYTLHEHFLWGCKSVLHPGSVRPPTNPILLQEFFVGQTIAGAGYVRMSADADPAEIVAKIRTYYSDLKFRNRLEA